MAISLPKSPDLETLKMLIRANHFLSHAKQHASLENEFDVMISIHNLDNAIEYMLRILIKHLEIEEGTGRTINTCELAQLIGEIQRYLKENSDQSLSYVQEMKMIRELRNMVQHAMILPVSDVNRYLEYGTRFFEKTLLKFFGLKLDSIKYSTLIKSEIVKSHLCRAEDMITSKRYLEAIVASRDAFDFANFYYNNDPIHSLKRAPALCKLKQSDRSLHDFLQDLDGKVSLDMAHIDVTKYLHYLEYINCIPKEYRAEWNGNTVLQRSWEKSDAEFCYLFVANSVLQMENRILKPIQSFASDKNIRFVEKIGGTDIQKLYPERGCAYFEDDWNARLFYCDADSVNTIKETLRHQIVVEEFQRYWLDKLDAHHTVFLQVSNYNINHIVHNPAIWEVIVSYREIPFSYTNLFDPENSVCIDSGDRSTMETVGISATCIDIILDFLSKNGPLDSIEKALELNNCLVSAGEIHVWDLYSEILIKNLS